MQHLDMRASTKALLQCAKMQKGLRIDRIKPVGRAAKCSLRSQDNNFQTLQSSQAKSRYKSKMDAFDPARVSRLTLARPFQKHVKAASKDQAPDKLYAACLDGSVALDRRAPDRQYQSQRKSLLKRVIPLYGPPERARMEERGGQSAKVNNRKQVKIDEGRRGQTSLTATAPTEGAYQVQR